MAPEDRISILAAKRTPIGNFQGSLQTVKATQLGSAAIAAALKQHPGLVAHIDQVFMGCVLSAGLGQAPARQAALGGGLGDHVPCTTINKMCGSGMQSIIFGTNALQAGALQVVVAGGFESMSQAPYLLPGARAGYRLGHTTVYDHMLLDGLEDAYQSGCSMAYFAEQCATEFGFDRNRQDNFALSSLQRAQQAMANGLFNDEITAVDTILKRSNIRVDSDQGPSTLDPSKIPNLKPIVGADGTITAANASSISDGAAAIILARESTCRDLKMSPLAHIIAQHSHAQAPQWFTTAPVGAIQGVLDKSGWTIESVDLFEINEAFAVVPMAAMQQLKIPRDKVNIHGGACVLGHPIGASGARIVVTLVHALRQQQLQRGIAALCIGGGEATAIAIELADE